MGCVGVEPDTVPNGSGGSGGLASGGQSGGGGTGFAGQTTGGVSGSAGGAGLGGQNTGGLAGGGAGAGAGSGGTGGQATGGAGGGTGGWAAAPTFDTVKLVFQGTNPPCVASDCHGLNTENILELAIDERLHNTLLTHMSAACGNIPVVTPGDPTRSALIHLLKGPCGETPRMPRGCIEDEFDNTCVPDDYIAAIEEWVRIGAPQ